MTAQLPKRIGIFVTAAFVRPEYIDAVSGHVQIPLMVAGILSDAGHDVTVITTQTRGATCLPYGLSQRVKVCLVSHATRPWPQRGIYPLTAAKQMFELLILMKKKRFDVVHFFGGTTTGLLLCGLKSMGVRSTAFYSPIQRPPSYQSRLRTRLTARAFKQVHRVLPTADCVSAAWSLLVGRPKVRTLYPGIVKPLSETPDGILKNSVLFWRNAGYDNGVDIAIRSFRKLAPKFPSIRFVFAVRPHDSYEQELCQLGREFNNIDVYIYPYADGMSLARLLNDALFVVQPFRRLSINPQMSILETLYAGVPVITTEIESNNELVREGRNGLLIPPNDEASLSVAIERLLNDLSLLSKLTRNARAMTERQWNWGDFRRRLLQVYNESY